MVTLMMMKVMMMSSLKVMMMKVMKMTMAVEMINNGKMPGCISSQLHCSSSRPCIHLKVKALHSPWWFGNLGKACTMSPELSM